jgi:nucleoside-diphosphate-sugar epimerase
MLGRPFFTEASKIRSPLTEKHAMNQKVFVAGAAGAVGTALVPMLIRAGYTVYGTTRRTERAQQLEAAGAIAVIVDVFDRAALAEALKRSGARHVLHQLTDLPPALDPAQMERATGHNARIRDEGTRNLVDAALAAGCSTIVAQSVAWAYAPGAQPYVETQPLDLQAEGRRSVTVRGVSALETCVLDTPPLMGTVLRYGQLYGPGTGFDAPQGVMPVHVEAAAHAALLALQRAVGGVFNVAEDNAQVCSVKAQRVLGWNAGWRGLRGSI